MLLMIISCFVPQENRHMAKMFSAVLPKSPSATVRI